MDERLHVDTDGGVDDALALMLLVRAGAQIASVSAVFGNTHVEQAASNVSMVLRQSLCPADVFVGAERGLHGAGPARGQRGHGVDGLNGFGGSLRRRLAPLQRAHGLSRLGLATHQRVKGVFLGPLTNLAQAVIDDPTRLRGWRPLVMAGAFAVEGRGETGTDFNTWCDPDAMQRVLLYGVAPRVVPLDVTSLVFVSRQALEAGAAAIDRPLMRTLVGAARPYMDFQAKTWGGDGCRPHDAVVAACALWPDLFTFEPANLRLDGAVRGRLVRDAGPPNAELCTAVDADQVRTRLLATLFGAGTAGLAS
jgi:inosine-uridine nucleoside N-ribohydrolase